MIRVATSLLIALSLVACGSSDDSPSAGSNADLVVLNTSPAEVYAGETVTFIITVANEGPAAATDVGMSLHLDGAPALGPIACVATGGATCPAALGAEMTLTSLPAAGGLIFRVDVSGAADIVGPITTAMIVTAAADTDRSNNTGESTTVALDPRSGDYTVFASNGAQYTLSLNFNEMSYQMVGSQVDQSGAFTRDADGIGFVFAGTARFRMAEDMVVGGYDFNLPPTDTHPYDHGVRPFVATRRASTDLAALNGRMFNLMGINLRRNNNIESVVLPATFGDRTLSVCAAPVPVRVDQCPGNFLTSYVLTVVGSNIKGVSSADNNDVVLFRMAQSGSSLVLLRAEDAADNTGRHFRVGLPNTTGLAGGSFATSSTRTAWGSTTLSDTHYAFKGTTTAGTAIDEQADLTPLNVAAPTGLRRGLLSTEGPTDGAPILLAQSATLALMLGERGGAAEGVMDISGP